jgi:polysaccharide export outer membrane protein
MQKIIVTTNSIHRLGKSVLLLIALATFTGCQSPKKPQNTHANPAPTSNPATGSQEEAIPAIVQAGAGDTNQVVPLREGDILKVTFPGSPSLNTVVTIRKDGIIQLPLVGEVKAAGETPAGLDQKLVELYAPQLTTKEVSVEVQSAAYPIYVTGAVLRPGKIMTDHSMTALEAVMEAGGFNYELADTKHVVVIREEAGGTKNYILDLKAVMDGKTGAQFYLKPSDIIRVKEKIVWF